MISRSVILALLGTALLVANVNYVNADYRPKDIIEIDDTNNPDNIEGPATGEATVTEEVHIGGHELPSFSTPRPTTEPPVVEQELPEEVTQIPTQKPTQPPKESHGLLPDLHNWLHGIGETWKDKINKKKDTLKDILGLKKKH